MNIANKIKQKLWHKLVSITRDSSIYPYIYRSYWHYLFNKNVDNELSNCYYAARPNPGAGIGHQMANWIAGFWYAKLFGVKFAHLPFSTKSWDEFLGFGDGEQSVCQLCDGGYAVRRLPLFNINRSEELELNRKIIRSYGSKKVVFIAEQDQFYRDQYGVMGDIKDKFHNAPARQYEKLTYSNDHYNIAIHVRRGDIMADPTNTNLAMRYLSNDYFERVLKQVVREIDIDKPIHIYFFSQGRPEDYPEFWEYENLHWCLSMGAKESFLHMVYADLLITSKSSFSYKPALLNNGIKVCPRNFWHGYPPTPDWVLVDNDGSFDAKLIKINNESQKN